VVFAVVSVGAGSKSAAKAGKGAVVGRVTNLDGRPVGGATIWADSREQPATRAQTGTDGRFRLGPISDERPATIWVEAEERGLAREHFDDVRVFAGRETDIGDLPLAPGTRLSVRVVDATGHPLAGASASLLSRRHVLGHTVTQNGPDWSLHGDDQGRIKTPALPVGLVAFVARAPGKALRRVSQVVEPGQAEINLGDFTLDDERPITGVVVDQNGRPLAGASVVVDGEYDHPTTTDLQGRFAVRDAAIDAQWFQAEARGYFDQSLQQIHELKGKRTDHRIVLQEAFTIEGSVVDAETGDPIDFDHVQLCTVLRDEGSKITLAG
jgi:hypothetical protein